MASETQEVIVLSSRTRACGITPGKRRLRAILYIIVVSVAITVAMIPTVVILATRTDTTITTTVAAASTSTETTDISAAITTTPIPVTTTVPIITTTTSVTSSTTSRAPEWIKPANETVYATWNTTAGKNSLPATPGSGTGTYWSSEPPEAAIDNNLTTEYTNHGHCNIAADPCGLNTGFYVTLNTKPFLLAGFHMATNRLLTARDPMTITIEGSNHPASALTLGTSWNLIYNGSSGLEIDPDRSTFGPLQTIPNSISPFSSYRLLVTSKRDDQNSVSFSDLKIIGRFP